MTLDKLVRQIVVQARQMRAAIGEARWYIFGSALSRLRDAADLDILVICESDVAADAIRNSVDESVLGKPIHLSILTEDEEAQVSFVLNHGCIRIFPIDLH